MKIVILTSTSIRHDYFCLQLAKKFTGIHIFRESKNSANQGKSLFNIFWRANCRLKLLVNFWLNIIFANYNQKLFDERKRVEQKYFGLASKEFRKKYDKKIRAIVKPGETISNIKYVRQIKKLKPDVIVVMGTGLIKKQILSIPRLGTINIHTGLSPYYRGGLSNFWPIINQEPQYCGVTIHKMSLGIDAGDIIYHGLVDIKSSDGYPEINCKAIILGTKLMIKALKNLKAGKLQAVKQWQKGRLYYDRDFNGYWAYRYWRLIEGGAVKHYLSRHKKGKIIPPKKIILS